MVVPVIVFQRPCLPPLSPSSLGSIWFPGVGSDLGLANWHMESCLAIAIGSDLAIPLPIKISLRWINDVKWPIVNPKHAQGLQETEAQKKKKKERKEAEALFSAAFKSESTQTQNF